MEAATPTTGGAASERLERIWAEPETAVAWLTTTDHKRIGVRYLVTAGIFFVLAGLEALTMRLQLAVPRNQIVDPDVYNELFTMHGTTMIFLFATPFLAGFGNYFLPLQIGARDMAFPRLNAFSYWVFLGAGAFMYSSFLFGLAPNAGWFNYTPLSSDTFSPDSNIDFYNLGLLFLTISTTAGAANFIVTFLKMRAPGMSLDRIPLYCWAVLASSIAIIFALPALSTANIFLELEREFDWHFFDVQHGGEPILWQHLFWLFGHPDVYIIFLPAVGIVSAVIPIYSRRPIIAYRWLVFATLATAMIGFFVWVHHMFALGLPQIALGFFAAVSMVITIPSAIQVFAWIATMIKGAVRLEPAMLFAVGFIVVFVMGGVTGVMFAAIPFDEQVTDSYFVVAHFHYVLFGGAVFPMIAGLYHWLPKMSGRMPDKKLGTLSFWLVFVGFNVTFFPMHITGLLGMPRRVYTYEGDLGWDLLNLLSTIGAFVLATGLLVVLVNVVRSLLRGAESPPDPWGGDTLEWMTTSPPPAYNFTTIPTVSSAHPTWDARDAADADRRTSKAELVLAEGEQAMATSELEGDEHQVMDMPEASLWPFLLMLSLMLLFGSLIGSVYVLTAIAGALVLACLAGWHRPQEKLEGQ